MLQQNATNTLTVKEESRYIAHLHLAHIPCVREGKGRPLTDCEKNPDGTETIRVIVPLNYIDTNLKFIETVHFGMFMGSSNVNLIGYIINFIHPLLNIEHDRDWREDKISLPLAEMGFNDLPAFKTRKPGRFKIPVKFTDFREYFESYTVESIYFDKIQYIINSPYRDEINLPKALQILSRTGKKIKASYGYSRRLDE